MSGGGNIVPMQWASFPLDLFERFRATAAQMFLSFGSSYSLIWLGCTLALAALFTLHRRRARSVPVRALARALLPRRLWRSASGRADLGFAAFNIFLGMLLLGWAILSFEQVSIWTGQGLTTVFGPPRPLSWPWPLPAVIATVALFLAYEFAYWFDHYLSHKLPFLWQFHLVHHSAESLSLATNFRVHPVDTIVFYNIVALFTGLTAGTLGHLFGAASGPLTIAGTNVLLLAAAILLTHLQHSHLPISFTGLWGKLLLSPAHHQIHHSADPAHYNRNFGSSLALFDHLFGTLHMPAAKPERLTFGVPQVDYDPHSLSGGIWMPLKASAGMARDGGLALSRRIRRIFASAERREPDPA